MTTDTLIRPMPAAGPNVVILFAAFTDSWSLFDRLGSRASTVLSGWLTDLQKEVEMHGGAVVKTVGNGLLTTFDDRANALRCAMRLMERVVDLGEDPTRHPGLESTVENAAAKQRHAESTLENASSGARLRVGMHYGPVVREGGDIFGDAVNLAFRVQEVAAVEQIIATQEVVEALPPDLRDVTRAMPSIRVRGRSTEVDVVEVVWEPDGATQTIDHLMDSARSRAYVVLHHRGERIRVDHASRSCLLGRGDTATLVVADNMASREHARVEFRGGQLLLTDFSTNGTYVRTEGGDVFLRRDALVLRGSGSLALGRAVGDAVAIVEFECSEG